MADKAAQTAVTGEEALILAAERLFAEKGIEAVALRQVNQAANQKNMSAAHYHFGSRDGLVEAVVRYRVSIIDERRQSLLSRNVVTKDVRFYLEAFILPLVSELEPRNEGNHYIRFMQQYEKYCRSYELTRSISPAGVEIYDGIEYLLGYLPEPVRRLRISHLINLIHSIFAGVEERLEGGEVETGDLALIASNAIDMVAGALTAPPSAHSLQLLPSL